VSTGRGPRERVSFFSDEAIDISENFAVKTMVATIFLVVMLCLVCVAESAETPSKQERWQKLWDTAERMTNTLEGHAYERQWLAVQNSFWPAIAQKCMPELKKEHVGSFRAILVIDDTGRITDFLPSQDSEAIRCFKNSMMGRKYPKPPDSPFYEGLVVKSH